MAWARVEERDACRRSPRQEEPTSNLPRPKWRFRALSELAPLHDALDQVGRAVRKPLVETWSNFGADLAGASGNAEEGQGSEPRSFRPGLADGRGAPQRRRARRRQGALSGCCGSRQM